MANFNSKIFNLANFWPRWYLCQSLLTLQAKACGPWLLGLALDSRCHLHCRSVRTFTVKSPGLPIFSPPKPTYRCPFTEPLDGFKSTFGHSSGFTTRPRLPSVSTRLLWMDMFPIVTAFRSTSSGSHSPLLELSLGRSSPSLEMSYCGAFIGRRWYTPSF